MFRFTLGAVAALAAFTLFAESASAQSGAYSPSYYQPGYSAPQFLGRSGAAPGYGAPLNCPTGYCGSTGNGKGCCANCRPGDCAVGRCSGSCRGACSPTGGACCSECRPGDCARGQCSPNCRAACCTAAGGFYGAAAGTPLPVVRRRLY